MRACGTIVNDTAKIHCANPTINNHCILFKNSDLKIPLQLLGTFLYFYARLPIIKELHYCDKIFIISDTSN